ncbi:MAG: hypothetical protein EP312_03890 [Gammaproteobacteria bacterium]|nr:MAG: hypothetical protein EP312_03890 [Gammaproteobacteria bacterium]
MKCGPSLGFSSLFLLLLVSVPAVWAEQPAPAANDALPVVKLSPKVREASRDRAWFEQLPCEQTGSVTPANEQEARWLELRVQACVRQYEGYVPGRF